MVKIRLHAAVGAGKEVYERRLPLCVGVSLKSLYVSRVGNYEEKLDLEQWRVRTNYNPQK